jgi:hypothetical protein
MSRRNAILTGCPEAGNPITKLALQKAGDQLTLAGISRNVRQT